MWVIGAIIAAAGMQVYIVWGTVRCHHFLPTSQVLKLAVRPYHGMEAKKIIWSTCSVNQSFS